MHAERQRAIMRTIFALADRDSTQLADAPLIQPADAYLSPALFEREREMLLRRRPVVACLSADLRESLDYYATTSGDVPIVIVRQPDTSLRALANVCRHRGSPLVAEGAGRLGGRFHCGFHGWTYDPDGALVARPHSAEGFATLDDGCYSLMALPVAERHGLVFVRPTPGDPVDVDGLLCGMGDELAEFGFDTYHRFDEWQSDWLANWKLLAETFLETYHVPALHPKTVGRHFTSRPSLSQPFGPNLRFHSLMKTLLDQRDRPESEWDLLSHGTVEYFVAPNTVLNYSVDHVAVYRFEPLAADRTRVTMTVYTPQVVSRDEDRIHYERTIALHQRVSGGEDFPQQERVQRSLASGAMPEVVFGRNEPAVIHFHRSLNTLLA